MNIKTTIAFKAVAAIVLLAFGGVKNFFYLTAGFIICMSVLILTNIPSALSIKKQLFDQL